MIFIARKIRDARCWYRGCFWYPKQTTESDQTKLYAQSSQVGSLKGNTTMIAEQSYAQTASTVKAIEGDVNILAQKLKLKQQIINMKRILSKLFSKKALLFLKFSSDFSYSGSR